MNWLKRDRGTRNLQGALWAEPAFLLAGIRYSLIRAQPLDWGVSDTLVVNEIYLSLQGESTFAGLPCIFVRLTACDLRCSYCDTAYAFTEGKKQSLAEILAEIRRLAAPFSQLKIQRSTFKTAAG